MKQLEQNGHPHPDIAALVGHVLDGQVGIHVEDIIGETVFFRLITEEYHQDYELRLRRTLFDHIQQ